MALTASDIMQTQVVTVAPTDPLSSVQRLFFEEEIHGAPVVPPDAIAEWRDLPLVASVAGGVARGRIRPALARMGYRELRDSVCPA